MSIEYTVRCDDPAAHEFLVEMEASLAGEEALVLRLPTWIPGSYLIREFAVTCSSSRPRRCWPMGRGGPSPRPKSTSARGGSYRRAGLARCAAATACGPSTRRCAKPGSTRAGGFSTARASFCASRAKRRGTSGSTPSAVRSPLCRMESGHRARARRGNGPLELRGLSCARLRCAHRCSRLDGAARIRRIPRRGRAAHGGAHRARRSLSIGCAWRPT